MQPSGALKAARGQLRPIRALIVDDSAVVRTVLGRMLERDGGFEVAGLAATATQALDLLTHTQVDVILLDVEMPGTDGITALPQLIERSGGARVVIVSSFCEDGATATLRALALGAADTLLKPGAANLGGRFADLLSTKLKRLGQAAPAPRPRPVAVVAEASRPADPMPARRGRVDCIAIGSSTGGIQALSAFFAALPRSIAAPILVTQHLPPPFMPFFARQIADMAGRPARVAADGMEVRPGEVLVAPGEGHLTVVRLGGLVRVAIDRSPQPSGCLPSVDPMLASLVSAYGTGAVGVVLSGIGRDGSLGADELVAAGGEVIAQDQASSVVWGMPGVIAMAGLASVVRAPADLAGHIARRIEASRAWS